MSNRTHVEEYRAVVETLNKYNEGGAKADSSIMRRAFHADATVYTAADGKLSGGGAQEALFDVIDSGFSPSTPSAAFVHIDIVGDAASARIDTDNLSGFRFTDFFNLLKVEGEWTIISKIFHTHEAPQAAN